MTDKNTFNDTPIYFKIPCAIFLSSLAALGILCLIDIWVDGNDDFFSKAYATFGFLSLSFFCIVFIIAQTLNSDHAK